MAGKYNAIIIGGGHNGLVASCYLAKAGRKVLLLERRYLVGGACVTEENVFPGFKVSTAAYVNSLFSKEIIHDLKLHDLGFGVIERDPSSFTPFHDGRHLFLSGDPRFNREQISKFSTKDAEAYPKYEEMLLRVANVIEPMLKQTPPNVLKPGLSDLWNMMNMGRSFQKLGPHLSEAVEVLTGPARQLLDRWFESEQLKGTLATDAIIGAFAAPSMPGTAYVLFHHVMGETNGKRGVWSYVRGGMGGLTQAIAKAAQQLGVDIRTNAEVAKIKIQSGKAVGVVLANGDEFQADQIASGIDMRLTFERMIDAKELPADFLASIRRINYDSASLKINVALSEPPYFKCMPDQKIGPQHRGTMHMCPDQDFIERAYDDAKYGEPSRNPVLECTMPSSVDDTVAPKGQHLMSMFVQYAPYKLKSGNWDTEKEKFADRCFDMIDEYAPNFKKSVIARQVLSPVDLERTFNLTGGNIFQGAMPINQLFMFRPVVGWAGYKTPIRSLFLCGSAAHPGGGVMGIAGQNAAKIMLKNR